MEDGGHVRPPAGPSCLSTTPPGVDIRHILFATAGGHMAEATPTSPRPGVAMVTSAGRHQHRHAAVRAMLDSIRSLHHRQVPLSPSHDAFQECDTTASPCRDEHNWLIQRAEDIRPSSGSVLRRHDRPPGPSRHIPRTSPTRPWSGTARRRRPPRFRARSRRPAWPGRRPADPGRDGRSSTRRRDPQAGRRALRRLPSSPHPVVTRSWPGAFPDDHPQCLGMPACTATTPPSRHAAVRLLIALGSRFDDR